MARKVIQQALRNSEFKDYTEIKAVEYEPKSEMTLAELLEIVPIEVFNVHTQSGWLRI